MQEYINTVWFQDKAQAIRKQSIISPPLPPFLRQTIRHARKRGFAASHQQILCRPVEPTH
jgi:macrodomain Ter protein organizer (MatP/YcbG family)